MGEQKTQRGMENQISFFSFQRGKEVGGLKNREVEEEEGGRMDGWMAKVR